MVEERTADSTEAAIRARLKDLVAAAKSSRATLAAQGAELDASGRDPTPEMQSLADAGLNQISLPRAHGGLSDGTMAFGAEAFTRILVHLAAGDGSVGQNWGTNQLVMRILFEPSSGLPEATLQKLAREIAAGVRLVASNAESSVEPVIATPVEGGVRVKGVKSFNTNSGGGGYANVSAKRDGKLTFAIIPLNAPGVIQHHDWKNMGQRGTYSQTITYDDVFVPDGWHYAGQFPFSDPKGFGFGFLLHAALMLGIGQGALDATLAHLRGSKRVILPEFKSPIEDPFVRLHLGDISTRLRSAEALLMEVARRVEDPREPDGMDVVIDATRAKVACVQASLQAGERLFELTGARSTADKHRYDRFWRNARVFSVHDSTDAKLVWVGGWDLDRRPPPVFTQPRI